MASDVVYDAPYSNVTEMLKPISVVSSFESVWMPAKLFVAK